MAQVGIAELLEAGVHFGHQTRRWNPKMRRFIFGERGGNYIIDLVKTQALLEQAQAFASELAHRGGTVLFVGTKKQARDTIKDVAESADMPFVNHRWLGGLLTNFETISLRIRRLHDLERYEAEGQLELLPTRERMAAQADLVKLRANLGGVKNMQRVPDAMFVIDLKTEEIAVKEARRLRVPIIGLVDTNCDPDGIDYVIPGNDDAIRSCALITQAIGQVVQEGHSVFRAEEEKARKEAEERAKAEAEARAKREAEEQAKREAEEQAAKEAEEKAAAERAAGEKAAAEKAAAAAAAQQPVAETTPVPPTPADPATLEPGAESVTPMSAGPDARQPANPQSAPPETAAESEAETPEAEASEASAPPEAETPETPEAAAADAPPAIEADASAQGGNDTPAEPAAEPVAVPETTDESAPAEEPAKEAEQQ
ncbi:MAG TPA: 30S ribosomal protein S2 [Solirubrobacteraceae bacterium]|nr:30S ribosomal protein S2 [Solirubrobacteraceae bacterium]